MLQWTERRLASCGFRLLRRSIVTNENFDFAPGAAVLESTCEHAVRPEAHCCSASFGRNALVAFPQRNAARPSRPDKSARMPLASDVSLRRAAKEHCRALRSRRPKASQPRRSRGHVHQESGNGADERVTEASRGLGEAVVAGLVIPDHFRLDRAGQILGRKPGLKRTRSAAPRTAARSRRPSPRSA